MAKLADITGRVEHENNYRGTSLIRNNRLLGPYRRTMPRVLWWSQGGGQFLMSEVTLYVAEMCSGSETGSYLRLIDVFTQL